ncbi:MAG: hypothetical protein LM577_08520 [Thermoproteaceae archaeon]|nr:hypothetical protein [Thermoproteaceae archaeon]
MILVLLSAPPELCECLSAIRCPDVERVVVYSGRYACAADRSGVEFLLTAPRPGPGGRIVEEVVQFFRGVRTPASLREFCRALPNGWHVVSDSGVDWLAVTAGELTYIIHANLDAEIDLERETIKRLRVRGVELVEVLEGDEASGYFEDASICTPYAEWGL